MPKSISFLDRFASAAPLIITSLAVCLSMAFMEEKAVLAGEIYIEDDNEILKTYEFICDGKIKLAHARISKLLQDHKDNIHLLNLKAYIEVDLNNFKQAELDSDKVLQQDPDNVGALARRGYARLNLGKYKEGIADLDKLLEQVPEDYPNLLNRSKAHQLLGHKMEAARDYQLASRYLLVTDVSLSPTKDKLLERLKEINDCIDEDPKDPYLFLARSKCFYRLKRYDNAIADASMALLKDPAVACRARFQRAKIYLRRGNAKKAIEDLTFVIGKKPKIADWNFFAMCPDNPKLKKWRRRIVKLPDVYVERARAYSKEGSYAKAIADCNTALAMDKYNLDALLVRGGAYDAQKKFQDAADDYKTAVRISNNRKDTVYMLTRSLQKLNQVSSGRTDLLVSLTASLQDQGRHQEALNTVTKLLKTNPKDKSLYKAKIRSLLVLKRPWSAVTDADKLIQLDPKDADSYILRAEAETQLKEYKNAVTDLTAAIKVGGGIRARKARAEVYKKQGRNDLYESEMKLMRLKK